MGHNGQIAYVNDGDLYFYNGSYSEKVTEKHSIHHGYLDLHNGRIVWVNKNDGGL